TNPFSNGKMLFSSFKSLGVGRITLGAQSLCPSTLKILGRKHGKEDVLRNLGWARDAGISQVQVDLIYGLKAGIRSVLLEDEVRTLVAAGATGI
ncbi:radical SAM protein, partial [Klebsiella pneumoniae]|uniref:radical SAM protein n=1 Tax=Klebsiella pneumoniae TaxID=573 RepID=UPI0034E98514